MGMRRLDREGHSQSRKGKLLDRTGLEAYGAKSPDRGAAPSDIQGISQRFPAQSLRQEFSIPDEGSGRIAGVASRNSSGTSRQRRAK